MKQIMDPKILRNLLHQSKQMPQGQWKIKLGQKILLYSILLMYPTCYIFWCYKLNELWFKNNLRFLHPEIFHPAFYRYNENVNKFKNPSIDQELNELQTIKEDNLTSQVLFNLAKGGKLDL
ncbi:hypothetical protein PPERSA_00249 [Pseudocohnilembus persalinus]|uniref:Uncharacterized protein n=1 Tax=Pseudocohnilembus persalinus TaxID=266149 RepID=A0A0V0Q915_PSEPJ|nr:hypothetical protein PPERSA_00249 [Pseudocohnilembus persalinus]|eukprot:KRW98661.1 hypothetical protein PPERSA_00249 [Pseudocohnilembus persalinus]